MIFIILLYHNHRTKNDCIFQQSFLLILSQARSRLLCTRYLSVPRQYLLPFSPSWKAPLPCDGRGRTVPASESCFYSVPLRASTMFILRFLRDIIQPTITATPRFRAVAGNMLTGPTMVSISYSRASISIR